VTGSCDDIIRTIAELEEPTVREEIVYPLRTARCVFVDFASLRRDFPRLAPECLDAPARRRIEDWLIASAAVISASQAAQTLVNTPIETGDTEILAYRPPRYGRALVLPVSTDGPFAPHQIEDVAREAEGLLDVKGIGVRPDRAPEIGAYTSGLLPLADAFKEFIVHRTLEAIFRHAGSPFQALPLYGVIDPGIAIHGEDGVPSQPAGILVRRAHRRLFTGKDVPRGGMPEHRAALEVELLLRQYGMTSGFRCGSLEHDGEQVRMSLFKRPVRLYDDCLLRALWRHLGGGERVTLRCLDIQMTASTDAASGAVTLVDFDHFRIDSHFSDPLLTLAMDRPLRWGGAIRPGEAIYLQPRPELALSTDLWGIQKLSDEDLLAQGLPLWREIDAFEAFSLDLTHRYRSGEIRGEDILGEIEARMARTTSRWPQYA